MTQTKPASDAWKAARSGVWVICLAVALVSLAELSGLLSDSRDGNPVIPLGRAILVFLVAMSADTLLRRTD